MLQNMRDNAQGVVAKIIVGAIAVTFALFGVESIVGGLGGQPEVATVNGEPILDTEFQRALELKRRNMINQMGENFDPAALDENLLRASTLEDLIHREVLTQFSKQANMAVSPAQIDQLIVTLPQAQRDGKFSKEAFLAFVRNLGMTPLEFREALRKEMLINQMREGIVRSAFVTDAQVEDILRIDRQTRTFSYRLLKASDFEDRVQVSDADIEAFYEAHKADYTLPERVVFEYVLLSLEDLKANVQVSEEQVQERYNTEIRDFEATEQRKASHILIEVGEDGDEAARAKAERLYKQLQEGADFAELAKKESADPGSAEAGGDLGYAAKGTYVPEFEDVLWSLKEGEISKPVKTEFGYHIIRLDGIQKQQPPTLAESRDRIRDDLALEAASKKFASLMEKMSDLAFQSDDLKPVAEALGTDVKISPEVPRAGGGDGIWGLPAVVQKVMTADVLEDGFNSPVIELGNDQALVARKKELLPETVQSLADVREQIVERLKRERALELAREEGKRLASLGWEELSQQSGWQRREAASRRDREVDPNVVWAFRVPVGDGVQVSGFETDEGYIVVALEAVQNPDLSEIDPATLAGLKAFLAGQLGQGDYAALVSELNARAEIERL
ncbi:MAG: parvulin peptidyl-prolyl isomerase [Gammaproteobacteria bacterium]|nr:MAG: parvulin peptidyl-prolyl isomerase [Gammaproteobacteria bacterium]